MKITTEKIVKIGVIAAVYAAVTMSLQPISYGAIQFRLSEIMVLLAFIDPVYIPGLVLGCAIANVFSPLGIVDVVVGTFATFLSVYMISKSKNIFMASIWPVVMNGVFIGGELHFLLNLPFLESALYVAFGEFVVVALLGCPIFYYLLKRERLVQYLKFNLNISK
ncbi:QueT transporter family protein [Clostridiisalibacter paucivorans]|uniref:QueT transporter family protein n=1 Tax=Clostridiisalibacter paucivorans TaxID=408753 RepID=UPI00047DC4BA|nr:QueT transporter family protein [Clostridiisalibacter paucivorans]